MPHIQGFSPICSEHAHTLILGSMPSRESLKQQRYYAHPRNGFWPIMSELFDMQDFNYAQRVAHLSGKGISVWDVLKACFRSNSLDSNIDERSIVTNDFAAFFQEHPGITRVFFNGAKAESIYRKHISPDLGNIQNRMSLQRLPSTSPAYAALPLADKLLAWKVITQ